MRSPTGAPRASARACPRARNIGKEGAVPQRQPWPRPVALCLHARELCEGRIQLCIALLTLQLKGRKPLARRAQVLARLERRNALAQPLALGVEGRVLVDVRLGRAQPLDNRLDLLRQRSVLIHRHVEFQERGRDVHLCALELRMLMTGRARELVHALLERRTHRGMPLELAQCRIEHRLAHAPLLSELSHRRLARLELLLTHAHRIREPSRLVPGHQELLGGLL